MNVEREPGKKSVTRCRNVSGGRPSVVVYEQM
jgi:hypothetical protein